MDNLELLAFFERVPISILDALSRGMPYAFAVQYANESVLAADIAELEILRQFNPLEDIAL